METFQGSFQTALPCQTEQRSCLNTIKKKKTLCSVQRSAKCSSHRRRFCGKFPPVTPSGVPAARIRINSDLSASSYFVTRRGMKGGGGETCIRRSSGRTCALAVAFLAPLSERRRASRHHPDTSNILGPLMRDSCRRAAAQVSLEGRRTHV